MVAIIKFLNIHRSRSLLEKKTLEKNAATRANTNIHMDTNVNTNTNGNLNSATVSKKKSKGDTGSLSSDGSQQIDQRERKELGSGSRGGGSKLGSQSGRGIGKEDHRKGLNNKEENKESEYGSKRKSEHSHQRGRSQRVYLGEKIAADQLEAMETSSSSSSAFDDGEFISDEGDNIWVNTKKEKGNEDDEADSESALRKLTQL